MRWTASSQIASARANSQSRTVTALLLRHDPEGSGLRICGETGSPPAESHIYVR